MAPLKGNAIVYIFKNSTWKILGGFTVTLCYRYSRGRSLARRLCLKQKEVSRMQPYNIQLMMFLASRDLDSGDDQIRLVCT